MRTILAIGLSAAMLAASGAPHQEAPPTEKPKYTDPVGGTVNLEGVCSYSAESLSCWDARGVIQESLARRLEHRLEEYGWGLPAAFRKKNRVLMFTHDGPPNTQWQIYANNGDQCFPLQIGEPGDIWWGEFQAATDQKTAAVRSHYGNLSQGRPAALSNRYGAEVTVAGAKVEFEGSLPLPYQPHLANLNPGGFQFERMGTLYDGRTWKLLFQISGPAPKLEFQALDRHGREIPFVDQDGRPGTPPKTPENPPPTNRPQTPETPPVSRNDTSMFQPKQPKFAPPSIGPFFDRNFPIYRFSRASGPTLLELRSTINPRYIHSFRVIAKRDVWVLLGGIPLDPGSPR